MNERDGGRGKNNVDFQLMSKHDLRDLKYVESRHCSYIAVMLVIIIVND